jgi:hypothetical protein
MSALAAALVLSEWLVTQSGRVNPLATGTPLAGYAARLQATDAALDVQHLLQAVPREYGAKALPPMVRTLFWHPWALPDLGERLARLACDAERPVLMASRAAAMAMAAPEPNPEGHGSMEFSTPQRAIYGLDFLLNESNRQVRLALEGIEGVTPEAVVAALRLSVESTSRGRAAPEPVALVLRAAAQVDRAALVQALAHWDVGLPVSGDWATFEPDELPEELKGAYEGQILSAQSVPELGWLVVGGPGPNRYDMTRIAAVFDPGGDDRYEWKGVVAGSRAVVDAAGNDVYTADGVGGPAGALLGASLVVDMAGDDRYHAHTLGLGAAAMGAALLLDLAGNDTYTAEQWSIGSAFAGVAACVDLAGVDCYDAPLLSQGVGGPGAFGLLLDRAGDDRYRADRTFPSTYGTPATFLSFSQGCGFGYRAGSAGGVGALVDAAGDDRYECGEFGQGCGYYLSLGMLVDRAGDDLYLGNRYAQGTAAHQAFGLLMDDAGSDLYHSVTAAGQGAAWDMSMAMLVDRAGDDWYRADGLSQGAAAQQAVGVLLDLAGDDRYQAAGASQGMADGNQYHWEATGCPSLGVLWDLAGRNWFSSGRTDGQAVRTGHDEGTAAEGRSMWGLFIARPGPIGEGLHSPHAKD